MATGGKPVFFIRSPFAVVRSKDIHQLWKVYRMCPALSRSQKHRAILLNIHNIT